MRDHFASTLSLSINLAKLHLSSHESTKSVYFVGFLISGYCPEFSVTGMGVLPHLQTVVAVMGFVEDFLYGLHNS